MFLGILGRLLAIAMLVGALGDHAYDYFTILRIVVCIVAVYCGNLAYEYENEGWMMTFGGIAILFNPIIPFHMSRDVWLLVDLIVAGILSVSIFKVRRHKKSQS